MSAPLPQPRPPADLRCGHCNYNVHNLPSTICPECGSDLSTVGILTPLPKSHALRFSFPAWCAAWAVPFLVLALLTPSSLLPNFTPGIRTELHTYTCMVTAFAQSPTPSKTIVTFSSSRRERFYPNSPKAPTPLAHSFSLVFGYDNPRPRPSLVLDDTTQTATLLDAGGATLAAGLPISAVTIERLEQAAFPDGARSDLPTREWLASTARRFSAGQPLTPDPLTTRDLQSSTGNSSTEIITSQPPPHPVFRLVFPAGYFILYLATLPFLRRAHRRFTRRNRGLVFPPRPQPE